MLTTLNFETFDAAYDIMKEAFPSSERLPYAKQKNRLKEDDYYLCGHWMDDTLAAIVGYWDFDQFLYIEHFAVNAQIRNGGLGGRVLDQFKDRTQGRTVVLEVEEPSTPITKRRIQFYERKGFTLSDYGYLQPSMSQGHPDVPLRIMSWPQVPEPQTYAAMKDLIFKMVY